MVLPLSHLSPGGSGHIVWIASEQQFKNRLEACGFIPGKPIVCILSHRRGDIISCFLDGTVFVLRHKSAQEIFVELTP